MSLNQRIQRLEQTLAQLACDCPDRVELSWPGHQHDPHCPNCGGQRRIHQLENDPRDAEPLIRAAIPIMDKAYGDNGRPDFSKLSDNELDQLRHALHAVQAANCAP